MRKEKIAGSCLIVIGILISIFVLIVSIIRQDSNDYSHLGTRPPIGSPNFLTWNIVMPILVGSAILLVVAGSTLLTVVWRSLRKEMELKKGEKI